MKIAHGKRVSCVGLVLHHQPIPRGMTDDHKREMGVLWAHLRRDEQKLLIKKLLSSQLMHHAQTHTGHKDEGTDQDIAT